MQEKEKPAGPAIHLLTHQILSLTFLPPSRDSEARSVQSRDETRRDETRPEPVPSSPLSLSLVCNLHARHVPPAPSLPPCQYFLLQKARTTSREDDKSCESKNSRKQQMHRHIREEKEALSGPFPSTTMLKRRTPPRLSTLSVIALLCPVLAFAASGSPPSSNLLLPSDASALLAFKSEADLNGVLRFSPDTSFFFCQWQGVQCVGGRAVRLVLEGLKLGGELSPDSLTRLDQLRVLSLQNDSLAGPIPDLSGLVNLKTLFLGHNAFTGSFPPSILSLHRVRILDLSQNALTGPLPSWLVELDRLYYLRLDGNRFNGTVPPLNQSSLQTFNVSGNNLTGAIPVTPVLARFALSSYSWNPGLCGEIINKECNPGPPFFGTSSTAASVKPPPPETVLGQSAEVHGFNKTQPAQKKHKRTAVILGFSSGVAVLVCSLLCFAVAFKKQRESSRLAASPIMASDAAAAAQAAAVMQMEQENELEEKVKRVQGMQVTAKSGSLVFCAGEAQLYSLEQLMRGSAELLGRGTTGTTYKAVLDNGLIVSVKRMDGGKMAGTSREAFEQHMESVGGLRHPNLVPLRAYFQAKEERLLIYDYQPNGSLFSLIHGSKSARAKPLHWTSCLKIAEDVAQGLSYIHQAWRLVHGNLKSSNVLLGPDFEACLVDYCLSVLVAPTPLDADDPDFAAYRAPESRDPHHVPTPKSDVYAYGTLLLELLTSRPPSQHLQLMPDDLMGWVRSMREDDGGMGDNRLAMLLEIAVACGAKSPEQRPTMWQVLKMLQEIKEAVLDDSELDLHKEPC